MANFSLTRKITGPVAMFVAMVVLSSVPASAETVFLGNFGSGAVPGTVNAGDQGTSTVDVLGVWMEPTASGDTRIEITLPEFAEISGVPAGNVWNVMNARGRYPFLYGPGGSLLAKSETDFICGIYGMDIDPTNGEMYLVAGRTGGDPGTNDCYPGSNRYLARFNPASGKFAWVGYLGYYKGLEFLSDGTLLVVGGNNAANGRGSVHELNKSNAARTFRVQPFGDNRDLVFNPGDDMLYGIGPCDIVQINPTNWATSQEYRSELCNMWRVNVALLSDNHFLVREDGGYFDLEIYPTAGTFVSHTYWGTHSGTWPWHPMIASKTDASAVTRDCVALSLSVANCAFGSIGPRGAIVAGLPIKFNVPASAKPGVREGSINWYRGATLVASQPVNLTVLSPDVALDMTPTSGRYFMNDTFSLTIDMTAVGGKDVNNVALDVAIPSSVLTVTGVGGAGSCGLSRVGVRCTGINIAAGNTQTVTINVRADANGYAMVKAHVTTPGGDVDASNDDATSTFVVGTATDLVATGTKGGAGKIGTAMDLAIEVTNEGPDAAVNSVLTLPGDAGFDVGTATTDTGTCAASGKGVRCIFGTMAVDTTATVNVKVTPTRSGNLVFPAAATSDVLDVTPGNNTYSFEVSVPTLPFTIAIGEATPSSSRGDVRSVLQLAVTPDPKAETGVLLNSISGNVTIKAEGLSLKRKVLVFSDVDANGVYDETDPFVGSGSLSADDNSFTVEFAQPISSPVKKTSHFILAVQATGAPRIAGIPLGTSSNNLIALALAALLPLGFAGFAFGRRRAGFAMLGLMAIVLVNACSEDEKLVSSAKVSVTVTSVSATLQGDAGSKVEATGLPLAGPTVTLTR